MIHLYVVTNLINHKQYYGWTNNFKRRWSQHKSGSGSKLVYQAIQKYGLENFNFKVLCDGKEDFIKELEAIMIQENCSKVPYGYNLSDGGEGSTGYKPSQETRDKMSKAQSNRKLSQEAKDKMYKANLGRKLSQETKDKMSKAALGRKFSQGTREKISKSLSGKKLSQETRDKMSKARLGRKHSKAAKEKMRQSALARTSNPSAIPVIVNGVKFECIKDAAISIGCNPNTLRQKFRRYSKQNSFPENWGYFPKGEN